ncbi:MAG TPA: hypothetical protein VGI10_04235 [Polyangiaceae bacterium]|jgi:hypothetical protein
MRNRPIALTIAVALLTAVSACAIDDRLLSAAAVSGELGGSGSVSSGGSAGSGGVNGGAAGESPTDGGGGSDAATMVCGDVDPVANCVASLAVNPTFDVGDTNWQQDPGSTQAWQNQDADGRADSGSLSVQNSANENKIGTVIAGSGQCLQIVAGQSYAISAQVFIAGNQGSTGAGGINVSLFSSSNCSDSMLAYHNQSTLPTQTDVWSSAHMVVDTSGAELATARSMSVRVIAQKDFSAKPLTVLFDNVLIEVQ